jgi:hypothetical protein
MQGADAVSVAESIVQRMRSVKTDTVLQQLVLPVASLISTDPGTVLAELGDAAQYLLPRWLASQSYFDGFAIVKTTSDALFAILERFATLTTLHSLTVTGVGRGRLQLTVDQAIFVALAKSIVVLRDEDDDESGSEGDVSEGWMTDDSDDEGMDEADDLDAGAAEDRHPAVALLQRMLPQLPAYGALLAQALDPHEQAVLQKLLA